MVKTNLSLCPSCGQGDLIFDNLVWLSTEEAAIYTRRFDPKTGKPSLDSIYNAIYRRKVRAKKWLGKWMIRKDDLDRAIENFK